MDRVAHTNASIGLSMTAGSIFAVAAALAEPAALAVLPIPVIVGGFLGLICAPAAVYARHDMECRPSFLLAVLPTAATSFLACAVGGPGVAVLATFAVYSISCITLGLVARRSRRRLIWYHSNRCTTCGYDMTGVPTERCPECGNTARVRPRIRLPAEMLRP